MEVRYVLNPSMATHSQDACLIMHVVLAAYDSGLTSTTDLASYKLTNDFLFQTFLLISMFNFLHHLDLHSVIFHPLGYQAFERLEIDLILSCHPSAFAFVVFNFDPFVFMIRPAPFSWPTYS